MKRRLAGFLAGLVLMLSVLGAYLQATCISVEASALSQLYFVLEYYLGASGGLTGDNEDVNTIARYFTDWIDDNIIHSSWDEQLTVAANVYKTLTNVGTGAVNITPNMWQLWKLFQATDTYTQAQEEIGLIAPSSDTVYVASPGTIYPTFNSYVKDGKTGFSFIVYRFEQPVKMCIYQQGTSLKLLFLNTQFFKTFSYPSSGLSQTVLSQAEIDTRYQQFVNGLSPDITMGFKNSLAYGGTYFYYTVTLSDTGFQGLYYGCPFPNIGEFVSEFEAIAALTGYVPPVVSVKDGYGGALADADLSGKNVTIPDDGKTISERISEAKEADPGLTKDDVDAIVNDAVSSGLSDAPVENPDDGSVLGLLGSILGAIHAVRDVLSGIPTNIVASITLALRGVTDLPWFKAVSGFLGSLDLNLTTFLDLWKANIKHIADAIDNNLPGLSDLLKRLAEGIDNWQEKWAEQITAIDNVLNDITEGVKGAIAAVNAQFDNLEDWLAGLGAGITAGLDSLGGVITGAIDNVITNIGTLADAVSDIAVSAIDLPNVLINFFSIDVPAVKVAATGVGSVWDDKFSFIGGIKETIDGIKVGSEYNYPVIKMGTPPILRTFYDQDYIILINFGDYATYFLTARLWARAIIWFGFGLYVIRHHLDVKFTV